MVKAVVEVSGMGRITDTNAGSVAAIRIGGEDAGVDDVAGSIVEDAVVVAAVVVVVMPWAVLGFDVVAGDALAVAPFDVDVGGVKLAGAVSCVKATVVVGACALSKVFVIVSGLE